MSRQAIAVLSTENLIHNINLIRSRVAPAKIIAMVKANAYGHGIRSVGAKLDKYVDMLGVSSIDEALILRKANVTSPILLTQGIYEPNELLIASAEQFHVVFNNEIQVEWLEKSLLPAPLSAWIKINTGMGRLGFDPVSSDIIYKKLLHHRNILPPLRIMSHFACADDIHSPLNQKQIETFRAFIQDKPSEYSLCNSAGLLNFPEHTLDYVRPGILTYGISPIKGVSAESLGFKPVMTVQSSLMSVHTFKKGDTVGYDARYRCPEDMPVGIIAFGYGDGYPPTAQDGTPILVNNIKCPLIGKVSMDMIAVDLRHCPNAKIGDPAVLWGKGLPVEELCRHTTSNVWNIVTNVQNRVKFIWTR